MNYGNIIVDCDINPSGDSDVFRFEGSVGETIAVGVTNQDPSGPAPIVELYGPNGALIASACCFSFLSRFDATLSQNGMYTVLPGHVGSQLDYALTLQCLGACPPPPAAALDLDHFKCYKTKDLKNPKFAPVSGLQLDDQFGPDTVKARVPFLLCNPADKEGSGLHNPVAHLCCYKIKGTKLDSPVEVEIADQFGTLQLEVQVPQLLCQPCTKAVLP